MTDIELMTAITDMLSQDLLHEIRKAHIHYMIRLYSYFVVNECQPHSYRSMILSGADADEWILDKPLMIHEVPFT